MTTGTSALSRRSCTPPPQTTADITPSKILYGLTIFASAFLLFEVEPIVGKIILPWFGGVATVWAVCLLFFQVVLLLGYSYAHLLTKNLDSIAQGRIHAALLLVSLLAIRIVPRQTWKPAGPEHPAFRILLLLLACVGLPYFVLSTTSPLLQSWYANAQTGVAPYRFYALSNAGSMLALLIYPIVIEPRLSSSHQAFGWSAAYGAAVLLCVAVALLPRTLRARVNETTHENNTQSATSPERNSDVAPGERHPELSRCLLWIALAACSSALLLAVTNHVSQNIASVPFLWIVPLALYLLSFILCFDQPAAGNLVDANPARTERHIRWYPREFVLRLLGIAIGGMVYALSPSFTGLPWKALTLLFWAGLFVCCMFCHGELARLKPAPSRLTSFYLMVALGGALGASFVALLAPVIFSGYYELHVALGLCAILVLVVLYRDPGQLSISASHVTVRSVSPARGELWHRNEPPVSRPASAPGFSSAWLVMAGLVAVVIVSLAVTAREQNASARLAVRNFYGVLRVIDATEPNIVLVQGNREQPLDQDPRYRKLMNGTIDHGLQFLSPARRREPTTYYSPNSGVGIALRAAGKERALRIGAIGLGIGTVAAYGRVGDHYTFYEINPLVVRLASEEFTFLRDSPAAVNVVLGDARLSLERETGRQAAESAAVNADTVYDVLIVDAFSGDSIPVHLLTREAFELYFRHLQADGLLAVHISNQYLDLEPVVADAAQGLGKEAVIVNHEVDNSKGVYPATWILVGSRDGFLGQSEIEKAGHLLPAASRNVRLWTDDYSSIWRVLK